MWAIRRRMPVNENLIQSALSRLIQDKMVLVIVQEYSCFYVLPIVL